MTPENRHNYVETMMLRARKDLGAAERNMTELGEYNVATSRAYYSMFYAASALLGAREIFRSKHSGIVSAFGEHFAKTGDVDPELGKMLNQAFKARLGCDYDAAHEGTREEAEVTIESARTFLEAAAERLRIEGTRPGRAGGGEADPA